MPLTAPLPLLPARSLTEALAPRLPPLPSITLSAGTVDRSTPERTSAAVQWMVTSPLYQPAAFGWLVGAPLSVGAVLSTLRAPTLVLALLPAASVAVPLTLWFLPSLSVWGAVQPLIPERSSEHVKLTVTFALYQWLLLAARSGSPLMVGAILSI